MSYKLVHAHACIGKKYFENKDGYKYSINQRAPR